MYAHPWIVTFSICVFVLPEEKFAQAVCFLLVDLYILTHQAEKALHLLAVLEKMISQGSGNKNGKSEVSAGHWVGNGTSVCCVTHPAAHGDSIHRDAVFVCPPCTLPDKNVPFIKVCMFAIFQPNRCVLEIPVECPQQYS